MKFEVFEVKSEPTARSAGKKEIAVALQDALNAFAKRNPQAKIHGHTIAVDQTGNFKQAIVSVAFDAPEAPQKTGK